MKIILKNFAILLVLCFGLCLFVVSNHIGGWRIFIVKSGSMEPQIPTGAAVITQYNHPTYLETGDVITFLSPTKTRDFITHRITQIISHDGYIALKTKGDNNKTIDDWDVAGGSVVGKVTYTLPSIGYILSFAQSKIGILLFILIPAIYIIVEEINAIITLFKKQKQKHLDTSLSAIIILIIGTFFFSSQPTYALLSDTTNFNHNTFTVQIQACDDDQERKTKR